MPELPEVEIYRRYVERHALRQRIAGIELRDRRIAPTLAPSALRKALVGRTLSRVLRHGKHLFARVSNDVWLHLHFGMSGDLGYYRDPEDAPRFARFVIGFSNGMHLAYDDARLFGRVALVKSPSEFVSDRGLGPDALDPALDAAAFRRILEPKRGMIKAVIMSQETIAGIGNLYADETLFQASIHPKTPNARLDGNARGAIFRAMRRILEETIARKERGGSYPSRSLIQHREAGDRCPRCGGEIEKTVVMSRTTYYCARHQKG